MCRTHSNVGPKLRMQPRWKMLLSANFDEKYFYIQTRHYVYNWYEFKWVWPFHMIARSNLLPFINSVEYRNFKKTTLFARLTSCVASDVCDWLGIIAFVVPLCFMDELSTKILVNYEKFISCLNILNITIFWCR